MTLAPTVQRRGSLAGEQSLGRGPRGPRGPAHRGDASHQHEPHLREAAAAPARVGWQRGWRRGRYVAADGHDTARARPAAETTGGSAHGLRGSEAGAAGRRRGAGARWCRVLLLAGCGALTGDSDRTRCGWPSRRGPAASRRSGPTASASRCGARATSRTRRCSSSGSRRRWNATGTLCRDASGRSPGLRVRPARRRAQRTGSALADLRGHGGRPAGRRRRAPWSRRGAPGRARDRRHGRGQVMQQDPRPRGGCSSSTRPVPATRRQCSTRSPVSGGPPRSGTPGRAAASR